MPLPTETLGHLELDILQYVSGHHPVTVREVATYFAETSGQARTTVLTVMERLRKKGYLTRRKTMGVHHYAPMVPKAELMQRLVTDFVERVLGGSVSPFVAYLAQSSLLNGNEARKLEQLLERIERRERKHKP
jgi:predicted transcriptional regulator